MMNSCDLSGNLDLYTSIWYPGNSFSIVMFKLMLTWSVYFFLWLIDVASVKLLSVCVPCVNRESQSIWGAENLTGQMNYIRQTFKFSEYLLAK
jgi:hypothetical protein